MKHLRSNGRHENEYNWIMKMSTIGSSEELMCNPWGARKTRVNGDVRENQEARGNKRECGEEVTNLAKPKLEASTQMTIALV